MIDSQPVLFWNINFLQHTSTRPEPVGAETVRDVGTPPNYASHTRSPLGIPQICHPTQVWWVSTISVEKKDPVNDHTS